VALTLFALAADAACAAATVQAPPRPIGSAQVVVMPGQPVTEKYNEMHGHHHQGHIKKDKTKNDDQDNANDNGKDMKN
jgi:hypothetical protein